MSEEYFYEITYKFVSSQNKNNCVSVSLVVENPNPSDYSERAYRHLNSRIQGTRKQINDIKNEYNARKRTIKYKNPPFNTFEEAKNEIASRINTETEQYIHSPTEYGQYGPTELRVTNGASFSEVRSAVNDYFPLFTVNDRDSFVQVIFSPTK